MNENNKRPFFEDPNDPVVTQSVLQDELENHMRLVAESFEHVYTRIDNLEARFEKRFDTLESILRESIAFQKNLSKAFYTHEHTTKPPHEGPGFLGVP